MNRTPLYLRGLTAALIAVAIFVAISSTGIPVSNPPSLTTNVPVSDTLTSTSSSASTSTSSISTSDASTTSTSTSATSTTSSATAVATKATKIELLRLIGSASSSGGLTTINTNYKFSTRAGKRLHAALKALHDRGYKVSLVMIDLTTGKGVASSPSRVQYIASSIKGPYVAAVNKYYPSRVTTSVKSIMRQAITVSDNDCYLWLRNRFGASPMSKLMAYSKVASFSASTHYPYMSAKTLAKLWVGTYWYFYKETNGNSKWCRSLYTHSLNSFIYEGLGSKYRVYSKPGWYPMSPYYVQNDAGVVMANGKPYLISVMTSACGEYGMLKTLVRALDAVHTDMVD